MTLVAFNVGVDGADLVTDTCSYNPNWRHFGRLSKVVTLPHLETVVVTQGDSRVGKLWKDAASVVSEDAADFDELVRELGERLAVLWDVRRSEVDADNAVTGGTFSLSPSVAFCIGYSPSRARFRAVAIAADDGCRPVDVDGMFVIPSPFCFRFSDLELNRYVADIATGPRPGDEANLAALKGLPRAAGAPATPEEWAALALLARRDRTLTATTSTRLKVFVGGELWHTRLERGLIVQARTLTFDDEGEEMAAITAGTLHPLGQTGPCPCGSAKTYLECCLVGHGDEPCSCGSGTSFGACCSLAAAGVPG